MNEDQIKQIVEKTLVLPDMDKLSTWKSSSFLWAQIMAGANLIPIFGGAIAQEIQNIQNYKDSEFFRKYVAYIYEMRDTTPEERSRFIEEIQEKANDNPGNVLSGMIDRMDNINKEGILARLSTARIHGFISIVDFFRLSYILERIPYVDIEQLEMYKEDYYDPNGDTELLFASGVLVQTLADIEGNKYRLSPLGVKLMTFGLQIPIKIDSVIGTRTLARLG